MPVFEYDGVRFHFATSGGGTPFVFQHGLGGDVEQPFGLFTPPAGVKLVSFDCRSHGKTEPIGPVEKISISQFASDLGAFLDHLEYEQAIIGGISMGAAVALNFALRFGDRVLGLVLSRPAWLAGPNLDNAQRFSLVAELLRTRGPELGKQRFCLTDIYRNTLEESSDAAESLCRQFDAPQAAKRAVRLDRLPLDSVCKSLSALGKISVPTIVLANRQDPIHPFAFGEEIARSIPGATLQEITAKSVDCEQHGRDVQNSVTNFLQRHFL